MLGMPRVRSRQAGFALIEAVLALLVLCVGLLGAGRLVARQLAETRTANARATAVQYIDMLGEDMAGNPLASAAGKYLLAWDALRAPTADCLAAPCTAPQLADFQLAQWLASLQIALPGARATIFAPAGAPLQTGIAVAWPANERQMDDKDAALQAALLDMAVAHSGIDCPVLHLCHVAYVTR